MTFVGVMMAARRGAIGADSMKLDSAMSAANFASQPTCIKSLMKACSWCLRKGSSYKQELCHDHIPE